MAVAKDKQKVAGTPVNLGGHTTLSPPFVTSTTVYFRGQDNRLLAVDIVSEDEIDLHNQTVTTPCVHGDWVYFMGTDNALKAVSTDGTKAVDFHNQTASAPCADDTSVYFRGIDDRLLRLDLAAGTSDPVDLKQTTHSSPVLFGDDVYFQGTDDRLLAVPKKGGDARWLGGHTAAAPAVSDTMVVFKEPPSQETVITPGGAPVTVSSADGRLMTVRCDGNQPTWIPGEHITPSGPAAGGGSVYFRGAHDDAMWGCGYDGSGLAQIANGDTKMQTWSTPAVNGDDVAWQGVHDNKLWYVYKPR